MAYSTFMCIGAVITPRGFFGSGSSGPQMNAGTLNCQRSDQTVDQCSQSGAGNGTCEQSDVAGVICQGNHYNDIVLSQFHAFYVFSFFFAAQGSSTECTHGQIRLAGTSNLIGRVDICLAGQWGSVCADNWNTAEASVACRQLGFQAVGKFRKWASLCELVIGQLIFLSCREGTLLTRSLNYLQVLLQCSLVKVMFPL